MAEDVVSDELWENFHRAVNMSSRELQEWLATDAAAGDVDDRQSAHAQQRACVVGQALVVGAAFAELESALPGVAELREDLARLAP